MGLSELYDNSAVRRQDRLLGFERALELLQDSEYGFLVLGGGEAYGIPLNFVLSGENIYFHCAPEGEKLRRTEQNNSACFCVVGHTAPEPAKFTTEYESVMAFGTVWAVEGDDERMKALELIVEKYSPGFKETGRKYAEKSFHRTAILRFDISRVSGKAKKV